MSNLPEPLLPQRAAVYISEGRFQGRQQFRCAYDTQQAGRQASDSRRLVTSCQHATHPLALGRNPALSVSPSVASLPSHTFQHCLPAATKFLLNTKRQNQKYETV